MPCFSGSYLAWLKMLSPGTKASLLEQIFLQGQIYRVTNDDRGLLSYHLWTEDMPSSWAERNIHVGQQNSCKKADFSATVQEAQKTQANTHWQHRRGDTWRGETKNFSSCSDDSLLVCACLSVLWMQMCLEKHDVALQRRKHDWAGRWLSK